MQLRGKEIRGHLLYPKLCSADTDLVHPSELKSVQKRSNKQVCNHDSGLKKNLDHKVLAPGSQPL